LIPLFTHLLHGMSENISVTRLASSTHSAASQPIPSGVSRLATADFFAAALRPVPKVAVFDCDGTLWSGDAGSGFMNWSFNSGLLSREATDWLDERHRAYRRGDVSELTICGEMVQVYDGLRDAEMRAAAAAYFSGHVQKNIFPEMQQLVATLQGLGTEIWAVSSTNHWVIEEGVRRFGIDSGHVLAACVEITHGIVTRRLLDVPTDEGKVASLRRVGVTRPCVVFGNSVHDAAMLATAARPFPVNPSDLLVAESLRRGWPIYFPASVEPPSA